MASESILTYKKPGFPKTDNSESSYLTTIEYVGPEATLAAAEPAANEIWGDYDGLVKTTRLSPIEGTTQAELTVITEYFYDNTGTTGTAREVSYEIDWVMFQRPMLEHPTFRPGGGGIYELTSEDVADIEQWKNETDAATKGAYAYYNASDETSVELSANATKFAKGLEMGIESYEDYAPVARRITNYTGGPPSSSTAGLKDTPTGIPGLPTGYEWRKSADRAVRAGGQTRWEKVEEWIGAVKVLVDRTTIYF